MKGPSAAAPAEREARRPAIKVIGLGNVLMGDDAFGPHVTRTLESAWEFSDEVEVIDLGTPGLDLVPYVSDADVLIIVDTVHAAGRPGDLHVIDGGGRFGLPVRPRLGPHDPGLAEALGALALSGHAPRNVVLVGVVPQTTATGIGLSDAVRRAVPEAARAVVRVIEARGGHAEPLPLHVADAAWWETGAATPCTR